MAETKFIDAAGLQHFKTKQDAFNVTQFVALDANGVAKAEQLPSYVDDVIDVHVEDGKFYSDNAGVKGTELTQVERGKIYIDIDTGAQYRWSGSQMVQIGSALSTADRAVNDADGNSITATYATKSEVGTTYPTKTEVSTTYATKAELSALEQAIESGTITVGDNISVDENGKITLTDTNVTSALGYTPLSESNAMTNAEIDALFA